MLAPGMGPVGQGRVTEKGLHSVAAHPAHHLPSARRSKIPLPDPVLFLEPRRLRSLLCEHCAEL